VCIHTRPRPPLTAERGHVRAHDPPTLARVCVRPGARCVPSESERRYTVNRLRDEGARTAGLRASTLRGFPFPTGRLDARARGGMPHRWPTHDGSRRDHRRLAIPVFSPRARSGVCGPPSLRGPVPTTRRPQAREIPQAVGADARHFASRPPPPRKPLCSPRPRKLDPSASPRTRGAPTNDNTLAHSSPRAFLRPCERARGGLRERAPRKHIAVRTRSKPSRRPRSRTTRRPPVRARGSRRAPRLPERHESFSKLREKASPLAGTAYTGYARAQPPDAAGKHERMRETTYWSPLSRGSRP